MSAYIVDRQHIVYLVSMALHRKFQPHHSPFRWGLRDETKPGQYRSEQLGAGDYVKAAEVANMLWMENIKSVSHRYPGESSATLPGPCEKGYLITVYDITHYSAEVDIAQLFKAIDCYAYQSCEHDDWEQSEAFAFIQSLRHVAWCALPGYEDAAWGAPEPKSNRRAA